MYQQNTPEMRLGRRVFAEVHCKRLDSAGCPLKGDAMRILNMTKIVDHVQHHDEYQRDNSRDVTLPFGRLSLRN